MKLKLAIYEGREAVKVYEADTFDVTFGVIEDIIGELHLDSVSSRRELGAAVIGSIRYLKPFLRGIFDGITDDEIRHARVRDLIALFSDLMDYAAESLNGITEKKRQTPQF